MANVTPSALEPHSREARTVRTAIHSFGPALAWVVWAGQLAAALAFVLCLGSDSPHRDDYEMVPMLTGQQPVTAAGLWCPLNEHRILLPRLIYLGVGWMARGHFRALLVLDVLILAALAAGLIATARRLRGQGRLADAFFPLLLLHWSHFETLLHPTLVQFVASTALVCTFLALVCRGQGLSLSQALLAGICLLLLPLCGVNGLVFVPAAAAWLAWAGWARYRSMEAGARRTGMLMMVLAAAAVALVGFYYLDYHRPPQQHRGDVVALAATCLRFLGMSVGMAGIRAWPLPSLLILVVALASALLLLVSVWRAPANERLRPAGLLLFLGSLAVLTLGIGWGRSGDAGGGFASRYTTLIAPLLCCVYFSWGMYGPAAWGRRMQVGLFALMLLALPANDLSGLRQGCRWHEWHRALEADVANGLPCSELARRHAPNVYPPNPALLAERLEMLRRAGLPPFSSPSLNKHQAQPARDEGHGRS